jgi:hypothetical protein
MLVLLPPSLLLRLGLGRSLAQAQLPSPWLLTFRALRLPRPPWPLLLLLVAVTPLHTPL